MRQHCSIKLSDHDRLSQLAREDPVAFENLRNELITDFIDHQPEKFHHRLRGLQFRVDGIRRLSRTPLAALLKIQTLMWDRFLTLNQELRSFVPFVQGGAVTNEEIAPAKNRPSCSCQLIEMPRTRASREG